MYTLQQVTDAFFIQYGCLLDFPTPVNKILLCAEDNEMELQRAKTIVETAIHEFHAPRWIRACNDSTSAKCSLIALYAYLGGSPAIAEKDERLCLELEESHLVLRNDEVVYIVATPTRVLYGSKASLWPVEDTSLWPWGVVANPQTLEAGILQHIGRFLAPVDIIRAAGTCTRWRWALNDEKVLGWIIRKMNSCNFYRPKPAASPIHAIIEHMPPPRPHEEIVFRWTALFIQPPSFFTTTTSSQLILTALDTKYGTRMISWLESGTYHSDTFHHARQVPSEYPYLMRKVSFGANNHQAWSK